MGHFPKGWVTDPGMKALKESETVLNCDTFAGFALEAKHGDMQRPPLHSAFGIPSFSS
ncbi:MAG: hypothetical protein IPM25_11165 [Chloracidobacterium sp.]|nr:hypothetical protein [Chloracidobacterium sp.]